MDQDFAARFKEANRRLTQWRELKANLPAAQESLTTENYQFRQVEVALQDVEAQIERLQSASLGNFLSSMLGKRDGQLSALNEELEQLQERFTEVSDTLQEADDRVRDIEKQLTACGDPQRVFEGLCEEKEQLILEAGGENGKRLEELNGELLFVRTQRRSFQKAVQTGKHLIERLHNMNNALGRAKSKLVFGGATGVIGAMGINTVTRHGIEGLIRRVRDGMQEFGTCIRELDLSEATDLDLEIARLGSMVDDVHGQLSGAWDGKYNCDMSSVVPMMEVVQTAIGHLESKLDIINPELEGLEGAKSDFIEQTPLGEPQSA